MIALQHVRHGNFVTKIDAPSRATPMRAAFRIAFCSAWQITFSFSSAPARVCSSSYPPRAKPLKPVDRTTLSGDAITAPTGHLGSFDLMDAALAIHKKYSSQVYTCSGIVMPDVCSSGLGASGVAVADSKL